MESENGPLACGEVGSGRLAEWDTVQEVLQGLFVDQDLAGQNILITAGPTREALDPARYLSNRSSGKMGYALARTAKRRGAEVVLVSGPTHLPAPPGITMVPVQTAAEMAEAVREHASAPNIIIKAAAVADFRPKNISSLKIKKSTAKLELKLELELEPTQDILTTLGKEQRSDQVLVGFAAESNNHEAEGRRKLNTKQADLIVVNDILGQQTGFDVDTNQVTLITQEGAEQLELFSKEETANKIWDKVIALAKMKAR
ncbi:MAG: bifunctional phosphopantothenoylcysteine decarboxylase/phosphopantothenate--cysteine ligase CoaBC [Candidatus Electrothrix sp. MAN1_4]|nr:bifunctional phosphopantothenoylcysteine decarboxylase/phosphopantothenate--cysteine ligase CoaBC [Candidatus Electrothrix sp. MAN1_4]